MCPTSNNVRHLCCELWRCELKWSRLVRHNQYEYFMIISNVTLAPISTSCCLFFQNNVSMVIGLLFKQNALRHKKQIVFLLQSPKDAEKNLRNSISSQTKCFREEMECKQSYWLVISSAGSALRTADVRAVETRCWRSKSGHVRVKRFWRLTVTQQFGDSQTDGCFLPNL